MPESLVYPLESGIQSTGGGYRRNIWNWWLGEVELTFNPSFYPSLVRMPMTPMAGRPPTIAQSGWIKEKYMELVRWLGDLLWGGNHFGVGVFSPWVYPLIDP